MIYVEIAVMVCVHCTRRVLSNLSFDSLDDIQQRYGVETVVGVSMETNCCTEQPSPPFGSLSALLDLRVGGIGIVVPRGHTIREDTDVDIIAVGCVAGEGTTDAENFVVRVGDNTKDGHAST
jgi:hypothetical protein